MLKKAKRTYILLALFMLCVLLGISIFYFIQNDYREVELKYIGEVKVEPPLRELFEEMKLEGGAWSAFNKENYEREKRDTASWLNLKRDKKINIHWEQVRIDEDGVYYLGLGAKINKITYYYHTKYTNSENKGKYYTLDSIALEPNVEKSVITVYKGDVMAIEDLSQPVRRKKK